MEAEAEAGCIRRLTIRCLPDRVSKGVKVRVKVRVKVKGEVWVVICRCRRARGIILRRLLIRGVDRGLGLVVGIGDLVVGIVAVDLVDLVVGFFELTRSLTTERERAVIMMKLGSMPLRHSAKIEARLANNKGA